MIRWLWGWTLTLGWYALMLGGWLCWFMAHRRAAQLQHELTVMAHSWRYAARKE
jgi:hypothetical protein